jgi:nitroreductase
MNMNSSQVKQLILERRSPVSFSEKDIDQAVFEDVLDAGRWSASAFNEQPWRFIYASKIKDPIVYQQILDLLVPANFEWAQNAPVLMLVLAKTHFALNGKENFHALYDTGQAVGTMAIQATAHNLVMHQMAGFDREKAIQQFELGDVYMPVSVAAVGYIGSMDQLSEKLKQRELKVRARKEVSEIAFQGIIDHKSSVN